MTNHPNRKIYARTIIFHDTPRERVFRVIRRDKAYEVQAYIAHGKWQIGGNWKVLSDARRDMEKWAAEEAAYSPRR